MAIQPTEGTDMYVPQPKPGRRFVVQYGDYQGMSGTVVSCDNQGYCTTTLDSGQIYQSISASLDFYPVLPSLTDREVWTIGFLLERMAKDQHLTPERRDYYADLGRRILECADKT